MVDVVDYLKTGARVLLVPALAATLTGCSFLGLTPGPSPTPSTPSAPTASVTPSSPTITPTPTASPTGPGIAATGTMYLYQNLVSKKFTGACQGSAAQPRLSITDPKNDFFETVQVEIALNAGKVTTMSAQFGEDSEGVKRRLEFNGASADPGSSAKATVTGATYKVTGKAMMYEDGIATDLTPFTVTVKCASPLK